MLHASVGEDSRRCGQVLNCRPNLSLFTNLKIFTFIDSSWKQNLPHEWAIAWRLFASHDRHGVTNSCILIPILCAGD